MKRTITLVHFLSHTTCYAGNIYQSPDKEKNNNNIYIRNALIYGIGLLLFNY